MYKSFAVAMLLGAASAKHSLQQLNADATSLSELLKKNNEMEVPISMSTLTDDGEGDDKKEDKDEAEFKHMKDTEDKECKNGACVWKEGEETEADKPPSPKEDEPSESDEEKKPKKAKAVKKSQISSKKAAEWSLDFIS